MGDHCAWVFAGGDFSPDQMPKNEVKDGDLFVGVDRGIEHCLHAGYKPDLLIGDFDSACESIMEDDRLKGVVKQSYPSKKAFSDLDLALQTLAEHPPRRVVLLGVSGGRTDHMLFNWMLACARHWPFNLELLDGTTRAHVIHGPATWSGKGRPGQVLSLLAVSEASGVTTLGLQYPLERAVLSAGSTLGLSNLFSGDVAEVSLDSGSLIVMVSHGVVA